MRKIKIAQIGTGHDHAADIFATLRFLSDIFEVVGYAEVAEDNVPSVWAKNYYEQKREAYKGAKKYTVEEILSMTDLDAVAVETFDLNLVKYAQMAADRGFHVHMDKVPGESAEAFESLLSTVKRKKLAFSVGYMYRFNPMVQQAFERIRAGEIGKIHSVEAEMSCYYGADKREWLSLFQGGMMQYLGCHMVDLTVRLQGVPQSIVPYNTPTGCEDVGAKDLAFAVFQYPDGVATVKSSMLDASGYSRRHLVVSGEKGTIIVEPFEVHHGSDKEHLFAMTSHLRLEAWSASQSVDSARFDRYADMCRAFAAMVRGERERDVDLETEARVHRCLLAACGIPCDYKKEIVL